MRFGTWAHTHGQVEPEAGSLRAEVPNSCERVEIEHEGRGGCDEYVEQSIQAFAESVGWWGGGPCDADEKAGRGARNGQ
jgi:hypothetical protein